MLKRDLPVGNQCWLLLARGGAGPTGRRYLQNNDEGATKYLCNRTTAFIKVHPSTPSRSQPHITCVDTFLDVLR